MPDVKTQRMTKAGPRRIEAAIQILLSPAAFFASLLFMVGNNPPEKPAPLSFVMSLFDLQTPDLRGTGSVIFCATVVLGAPLLRLLGLTPFGLIPIIAVSYVPLAKNAVLERESFLSVSETVLVVGISAVMTLATAIIAKFVCVIARHPVARLRAMHWFPRILAASATVVLLVGIAGYLICSGTAEYWIEGSPHRRMCLAARMGSIDRVNDCLESGASADYGLGVAALYGQIEVMEFLLRKGADPDAKDGVVGYLPVHWAAYGGQEKAVRFLCDRKDCANATDGRGNTPLHAATASDSRSASDNDLANTICVLIALGADINARSSDGSTPLHYAVRRLSDSPPRIKCVETLLRAGADVTLKNNSGEIPLDRANDDSIRQLLIRADKTGLGESDKEAERPGRTK